MHEDVCGYDTHPSTSQSTRTPSIYFKGKVSIKIKQLKQFGFGIYLATKQHLACKV